MAAQRSYGGVSADERRAQRRAALLEAALEIIGTKGLSKLTVSGLCTRAGLNERYYYESFDSRDDVLTALFDAIAEELAAAIMAALHTAPEDTRSKAMAAIAAGIHLLTDDPRKAETALVAAMATPHLRARTAETIRVFARLVATEGVAFYGIGDSTSGGSIGDSTSDTSLEASESDGGIGYSESNGGVGASAQDAVVDFRATYLVGGLIQTLTGWLRGELAISRDELIEHTTDVFVLLGEDLAERMRTQQLAASEVQR